MNENEKLKSFADYTEWDMEDRDNLATQINKLDTLNGEIQTLKNRVQLQFENSYNIVDQFLVMIKHKYKEKEIDMIKQHFGFDIHGDNAFNKRQKLKNLLLKNLRKLKDDNENLQKNQKSLKQKKTIEELIEEYKIKTQENNKELEEIQKQVQEFQKQKDEKKSELIDKKKKKFQELIDQRDKENYLDGPIKDIMKSKQYLMGDQYTAKEFQQQNQNQKTLKRQGEPWISKLLTQKQKAQIHNFKEQYRLNELNNNHQNLPDLENTKFNKKKEMLENINQQVVNSVTKAFESLQDNHKLLIQINQKITVQIKNYQIQIIIQ